jgi:hypothetical protein
MAKTDSLARQRQLHHDELVSARLTTCKSSACVRELRAITEAYMIKVTSIASNAPII